MAGLNFGDLFEAVARVIPDAPAIRFGGRSVSWREFDERSNRLARRLLDLGLEPGARVAFYLRNSPAYLELLAACFKARLVHVNVNYRYVDAELWFILDNSDAEVVVHDAAFRGQMAALRPRLARVCACFDTSLDEDDDAALSFERACARGDATPLGNERSGDDLYFMYTGGTTGHPKAVMWPQARRIEAIGMASATSVGAHADAVAAAAERPVTLPICPLMHSTGFTTALAALCAGGCVVLLPGERFDADACLRAIERHRVTTVTLVGDALSVPILEVLRGHGADYDLSSVSLMISAGTMWSAPCKRELLKWFTAATLRDSLGSSEGSRLAAADTRAGEAVETGRFALGPNVKVFDESLAEVLPGSGVPGMIATFGPIPLGYHKDAARTAQTFPEIDGVRYAIPGDWCLVEADGTMRLLGRGSHCINTGGEKVFPEEVEEALKTHGDVVDAAVFGLPDPRWGQAVNAVVRVREGVTVTASALRSHLAPLLAPYKRPKSIRTVTAAFRADNGKLDYAGARRAFESGVDGV